MRFSLGIALLNEEDKLPEFFEQMDKQTVKPEIIFVDGGSKDGSLKLLKKYAKKNKNVKILNEKGRHRCVANAWNQAWDNATGELFFFGGVDFRFEPNFTKKIIDSVKKADKSLKKDIYIFPVRFIVPKTFKTAIGKTIVFKDLRRQKGDLIVRICRRKLKLRFDPKLGFGEDRLFFTEMQKKKFIRLNTTLRYSRASEMTFDEIVRRYMWYGRSMPRFLKRFPNLKLTASLALSVMMITLFPFVFFHPVIFILFMLPVLVYLFRGLKMAFDIWHAYKVKFIFLTMPTTELLVGILIGMGFFKYLLGDKRVGR